MEERVFNILPDAPDLRDRIYNPTLRSLEPSYNWQPYKDPIWRERVKEQASTQACTGFALSSMVESLADQAWRKRNGQEPAPEIISPFMLYYMARRYDDIPGDDVNGGSTARAAMKAWHKHGACRQEFWNDIDTKPETAHPEWIADAFKTPLGAYYRVDHRSIPDLHAAINEVGVVYATAVIHEGWNNPAEGDIPVQVGSLEIGGHAFLLVGYDEKGFWIQNSWGRQWGREGFARLSYADWCANGMDAWIGQLGVHISGQLESLTQGLDYIHLKKLQNPQQIAVGRDLLSSNPNVSAQQINPYVVNLENNGKLSNRGQFFTREEDLKNLVTHYLEAAIKQWNLNDDEPIDVALYAHGGLTPEANAEKTAKSWIPTLFAWKIFPVFFMWETGLLDTLNDCLEDVFQGSPRTAGATLWQERLLDGVDDRLESLLSRSGTLAWDEMKENAEFASTNAKGGLRLLYKNLMDFTKPEIRNRLRLHLIGHSAGAIFQAHLLPKLINAGLHVDGIYFMAPACKVELFNSHILPHYKSGKVAAYTQFHLADAIEKNDNCFRLYNKSLLYLVSNAFERKRGKPILGMEKFVNEAQLTQKPTNAGVEVWDWIASPTLPIPPEAANSSTSTTHGGFDSDTETMRAILKRISDRPQVLA